jgi:probable F420-dependent oxidoreductase
MRFVCSLAFTPLSEYTALARAADDAGFDAVAVSDHVVHPQKIATPYPYTADGAPRWQPFTAWPDPWVSIGAMAAVTTRLRFLTSIYVLPLRNPFLVAKAVATAAALSDGRVTLGVGVGWMREEFDALSMPFDHRGERADEQLEVFRTLFTQPAPSHDGRHYAFPEIGFEPKPVQAPLPIWVGGDTEPAFRRAARAGDAFHAAFQPLDEVAAAWRRVQALADEAGRPPGSLGLSVRLFLDPEGAMPAAKSIAGTPDQMLDTIGAWAAIGVDHVLLDPVAPGGASGRLAALERFAEDVVRLAD